MVNLGWTLQVLGLLVVAAALPVGLLYNALQTEVGMLAAGGVLFLVGRWLQTRER